MTDSSNIDVSIAVLALMRAGKLGQTGVRELLAKLAALNAINPIFSDVLELAGVSQPEINASIGFARADVLRGVELGILPIPISSSLYPASLRLINDAPPIIYIRGDAAVLKRVPGIAVVGTRKATKHGLTIAHRIASHVSQRGWVVVSGLALGIDAAAHEGALAGATPTIAVLAHGLDRASPRANEPLAHRILEAGGVWISEHPTGATAKPEYFVQRNRIQVGLSAASVIIEGAIKSGSMTQAEYCMRYRRALFAVLPDSSSIVSTNNALPRMLVQQRGATAIETLNDYPSLILAAERKSAELAQS